MAFPELIQWEYWFSNSLKHGFFGKCLICNKDFPERIHNISHGKLGALTEINLNKSKAYIMINEVYMNNFCFKISIFYQ